MKVISKKSLQIYTPVRIYKHIEKYQDIFSILHYTFDFKNQKVLEKGKFVTNFSCKYSALAIYENFIPKVSLLAEDKDKEGLRQTLAKKYLSTK